MSLRLAPLAAATLAAGAAGALAIACGHAGSPGATLPAAGTKGDDGSGLLARASLKLLTSSDEGGFEPDPSTQSTDYGYNYGYYNGFTYGGFGGDYYGFGGSPYASYQPQPMYNTPNRTPSYSISYATDGGSLVGQVTWPKPPRVPATVPGPTGCDTIDNRLPLGTGNSVEGAVVYLEKISTGRVTYLAPKPINTGGTVEARGCALTPRVQIFNPVPGQLTLSNGEQVPRALLLETLGDSATRVEQTLEVGATRTLAVNAVGVLRVADQAGKLPPAWIIASPHPYYTLSDASGGYRLDDIAPGDYVVVAWFPPVVTGVVDGVVQYGDPVVTKEKVTITKLAATRADLAL